MARDDILHNMIHQLGQSQAGRFAAALRPEHAPIDDRTEADLLAWARAFAAHVHFHPSDGGAPSGDWTPFFPAGAAARADGTTPPHLALFLAFLRLYGEPQGVLNALTRRHLDFHYRRVLGLAPRPARPDRAHVVIELKKNAAPVALGPAQDFLAGKDRVSGRERVYRPTGDAVIRAARVAGLRSLFVDPAGHGTVRGAPVANSADGLGAELPADDPSWRGFGHTGLAPAEIGFALASPVLRLKEGTRTISVDLQLAALAGAGVSTTSLRGAFQVYLTGEKAWLGPYAVSPTLDASGGLHFEVALTPEDGAVVDHDAAVHGYAYTSALPVLQVVLDPAAPGIGYTTLRRATLRRASIAVEVTGATALGLESDAGTLDPKKAFQPFGPEPRAGSRFLVACDEALSKRLTRLELKLHWKGAPTDFATHYAGIAAVRNSSFTARAAYTDAAGRHDRTVSLFESDQTAEATLTLTGDARTPVLAPFKGIYVHALASSGTRWATAALSSYVLRFPAFAAFQAAAPEPVPGTITFTLQRDFGHEAYRRNHLTNLMTYARAGGTLTVLNEPYTPVVQAISLSYRATTGDVDFTQATDTSFAATDLHFHHLAYFGPVREHAYQRAQLPWVTSTAVPLLHAHEHTGELLVGLRDLQPRDSVSVLFQVAEGSADPDLPPADIAWSVLCDNFWKPLGPEHVVRDTTNHLLRSGVIQFVIPAEATTNNTILPAGLLWLRAGVASDPAAVARLIAVTANAIEVELVPDGQEFTHLASTLPAGSIARLRAPLAAIKSIAQPYASFDGAPAEDASSFDRRVAERLRHKGRCLTPWDYERIVLEAFPRVHRVKCIPHARPGSWHAAGYVLLVVVPDLRNRNAANPLEPRVDTDTIARITEHVRARTTPQSTVHVANPSYQRVRFSLGVRFHRGFEFNFYRGQLEQRLLEFLCPWAFDATREPSFGGVIHRSTVLDFIEELAWVDYVTDFRMQVTQPDGTVVDATEARAAAPDVILVSAPDHDIREAP